MTKRRRRGFTLVELMVTVAILGILSTVAAARYAALLRTAEEGALKGDLGATRAALRVYYGETEGQYPADLAVLAAGSRYLSKLPAVLVPGRHQASPQVLEAAAADDAGGWLYNDAPGDAGVGSVHVNCTHTDTKGSLWSTY